MRSRKLSRTDDLIVRSIWLCIPDIVKYRTYKEIRFLRYYCNVLVKRLEGQLLDIYAVYKYFTALVVIKSHKQIDNSSFSGTCRSNNGNFLSCLYIGTEIFYDYLIFIVAEFYVVKLYVACYIFRSYISCCFNAVFSFTYYSVVF